MGLSSGTPPDGTKIEACFSDFFKTLTGAPQAKCLDPLLQGLIGGVQDLLEKQDPATLQKALTDLPDTLQAIPACLQPTASDSPSPSPTPTPSTTEASAPATTDSTAAVPVSATPTFTG
jgi:hypothetical protein